MSYNSHKINIQVFFIYFWVEFLNLHDAFIWLLEKKQILVVIAAIEKHSHLHKAYKE